MEVLLLGGGKLELRLTDTGLLEGEANTWAKYTISLQREKSKDSIKTQKPDSSK